MEEMQLDLSAPILSVRRIASKNDQNSKSIGRPGVVPFTWEQSPGRPKGVVELEADCVRQKKKAEEDDGDGFEDAVNVFSCRGSYSDCSVSGNSSGSGAVSRPESFSKDPEVHEFMMGRFLPAAKAMTTGPLETAPQRQRESERFITQRRTPVSLPYQHTPKTISKFAYGQEDGEGCADDDDEEEEEEEGYGGGNHFSRSCGVIPQFFLKSSFLLFNPVTGMKVRRKLPPRSLSNVSDHGSPAQSDYQSWEAVYKHKYKVGLKDNPALKDDASKLTSESNLLTFWSDSQTADESSYQDSPQSPSHEGKRFLEVPETELKGRRTVSFGSSERASCDPQQYESSSVISSIDRTVSVDSSRLICGKDELEAKYAEPVEEGFVEGKNLNDHVQLDSKSEEIGVKGTATALFPSLLPLPLPKSPTESWLRRTLPSGSSKTPAPQSLLSIQVQHRRRVSSASSNDFNCVTNQNRTEPLPQHTKLAL